MELVEVKNPVREYVDKMLSIKAQELNDYFEKEIKNGMPAQLARVFFNTEMNKAVKFYMPELLASAPTFVFKTQET